jgi:hypothetical protein
MAKMFDMPGRGARIERKKWAKQVRANEKKNFRKLLDRFGY